MTTTSLYKIIESPISKHKLLWPNRFFVFSSVAGVLFLIGSFFVNYYAAQYATIEAGNATTDVLLNILPVVNTDIIFTEGALLFIIFVVILSLAQPKTIPLTLKSIALFICVRSLFVIMTHLGPSPDHISAELNNIKYFSTGADLFFSGHTGLPFLMSLLFWDNKYLRWIFLSCSLIAASAVLLGHLHYTIDVFSAFFITFGISRISLWAFDKDARVFKHGLHTESIF